jgi:clan AA aspartic protease (TIGR02281 family)
MQLENTFNLTVSECRQGLAWACRILPAAADAVDRPIPPELAAQVSAAGGYDWAAKTAAREPDPPTTANSAEPEAADSQTDSFSSQIVLREHGGTFVVPVTINGRITLDFVIDSGAADVSVPADVVLTLMRTGTIQVQDFVGSNPYVLADGSRVSSEVFIIRRLAIGGHEIHNIRASVAPVRGMLLLGQSFLRRFRSWSIDNQSHRLLLD